MTRISVPAVLPRARVRSVKRDTEAMLGSASPRKPSVAMADEVVGAGDLAGRVPLEAEPRVVGRHADAVVLDAHEPLAAVLDRDRDARRLGVDGVLDQLLDDRGGALDDLAGGDLVGQIVGQLPDPRHAYHHPDRRNQVTIAIDAAAISATTHQNCAASPPGRCGSVTFMP